MQGAFVTALILQFPEPPKGNGALELIEDYFSRIHPARVTARMFVSKEEAEAALPDPDFFLAWLWSEGFKVVPVSEADGSKQV